MPFQYSEVLFYCPRGDFALEEALYWVTRVYIKESTDSWIYSQYVRKNLDLLEQGPRGIGR